MIVDHAMIYRRGGFIIQRHNELRHLEAFWGRHAQHVHQELTEESLPSGANRAPDARLGIHARGFWEQQRGYTSSTKTTGRDCLHKDWWTWNKEHLPCIRLARGKFELTNQDSAGGKILVSWCKVNKSGKALRDGIKYPRKGIFNFKNQTSWQKVKNMNNFVFLRFYFAAKNGSPAPTPYLGYVLKSSQFAILRSALLCVSGSRTVKRTIGSTVQEADFELDRCLAKI